MDITLDILRWIVLLGCDYLSYISCKQEQTKLTDNKSIDITNTECLLVTLLGGFCYNIYVIKSCLGINLGMSRPLLIRSIRLQYDLLTESEAFFNENNH